MQRLAKWFTTLSPKDKAKIVKDVSQLVLARRTRMCNFLEYKGMPPGLADHRAWTPLKATRHQDCIPPLRLSILYRWLRLGRQ